MDGSQEEVANRAASIFVPDPNDRGCQYAEPEMPSAFDDR
jgi:hypothetical protein